MIQACSFAILAVFYAMYLGKMLQQRKQGIQTDLLGKGKTGLAFAIEAALKVLSYGIVLVEVVSIFAAKSAMPFCIAGIVFGVAGDCVFVVSVLTMRENWRAGVAENEKTQLVTKGIYHFSRNPAFLGFDLVYISLLLMHFNWILLAVTALTMLLFHLQIVLVEEPFLITAFGEDYREYQKKVCRYLGKKRIV